MTQTTVVRTCFGCGVSCVVSSKIGDRQIPSFCGDVCRKTYRKTYLATWVAANRETFLAKALQRSRKNRLKNPDYFKKHYLKTKERKKKQHREWYAANKERAQAQLKKYAAANPDVIRRCSFKAAHKRRSIVKKVFVEHVDPHVVFERDKGICGICKKCVDRASKWEIDHVIPVSKGGAHAYANVQLAHRCCNRSKRDRVPLGQPTLFQVAV